MRNFPHCEEYCDTSFIGVWHEKGMWDEDEYWLLDKCIFELSEIHCSADIPRNIAWPLSRIFSYIMMSIQSHFDPRDSFRIENLDDDKMFDFRERFQLVVEGFFKGEMPNNAHFEWVNPLIGREK